MAGTNGRSTAQAERHARRAKEKADERRARATGAAGWVADRAGDWSLEDQDLGWMEAAGPSIRAAVLDLGLTGPGDTTFLLGIDEPYYLSSHAPPAQLAPDGLQLVSLARYLRPDERIGAEQRHAQSSSPVSTDHSATRARCA